MGYVIEKKRLFNSVLIVYRESRTCQRDYREPCKIHDEEEGRH